jgi:flagellar capping protein FliD
MDRSQMLVLALANVPTIITVLIGILLNNGRLNDLNARMTSFESRLDSLEQRVTALDHKFDTRFDLLLSKVVDLDNRLTRIETQLH